MRFTLLLLLVSSACGQAVRSYEGTLTIPTYEHTGREMEPPLFGNSTVTGMYPFTTYLMPFKAGGPAPRTYRALFVENEYLKVTCIPEFGGRIFSVYDKLRGHEMLYRNDVIKPAPYNPRNSWPQSGLELTGPHDLHMLTLHGEPYWAHQIVHRADGSVSLVLGELDPVYRMKVNLSATLHPGIAAVEIRVFCYNTRDARMPQMLWINTAVPATEGTRFLYQMSRTVGHTTADIADWPLYNGIDYSWDRNNKHMLGVFGIDIYDDFHGAYQFDRDYGVFRFADRRIVQGMKLWTFGHGEAAKVHERSYTDKAGPYVELQSGRHVWDGHYEWVAPHEVEGWSEWWIPVAGTGGVTSLNRDLALNLDLPSNGRELQVVLAATRVIPQATVVVRSQSGELLRTKADLDPRRPFRKGTLAAGADPRGLSVAVSDASGRLLMDYHRTDSSPGRKEYTPFTRPLENPRPASAELSIEELVNAAEFRFKELDSAGARALLEKALGKDPGESRAHLLLGIDDFRAGRAAAAMEQLEKTIQRNPYSDEGYYYLAMSQFSLGRTAEAERNLYYIWPDSAYFPAREFHLGRLALSRKDYENAIGLFRRALASNAADLLARHALAVALRESGDRAAAEREITALESIDPTSRPARAERYLLSGGEAARSELVRLLGGQSQEAIGVSVFYRNLERWSDAVRILRLVDREDSPPWGTPPEFYYTLAYCERRAGNAQGAKDALGAHAAAGHIDRFPYREESEAPLAEAVELNPSDTVARFALGCLLYYRDRPKEAILQWEAAAALDGRNFSLRRALGLAYAEQGAPVEKAAAELEHAVELNPEHLRTRNDLSLLYARAGRFDDQLRVLKRALERSPNDDDLVEGVLTANLAKGLYADAGRLVTTHRFAPRHRSYGLRDKYRLMHYAMGAQAFRRRDYAGALAAMDSAMQPPASLGVDDFQSQASPRQQYYRGRVLEALGRKDEAKQAYLSSIAGVEQLSGDRDSWSNENFFMVLSLDRLGRSQQASALARRFENFAATEVDSRDAHRRGAARYLLAQVRLREGRADEARKFLQGALEAVPDLLAARFELRGDALDAVPAASATH